MDLSFIVPTTVKEPDAREPFFIYGLSIKRVANSISKMNRNSISSPFSLPFIL